MIAWVKNLLGTMGFGYFNEQDLQNKYLDDNSRFIEVDGINVHYKKEGAGEPVVLIHGVLASLHTWDSWTDELRGQFTIYRIDLPGFGFSSLPENSNFYSEDQLLKTMHKLFHKLGLSQVHLVGNSLGGYIAWNYALEYPQAVKTLTAIDSVCYKSTMPFLLKLPALPVASSVSRLSVPKILVTFGASQVYGNSKNVTAATKQRYFDLLMRKGNKSSFVTTVCFLNKLLKKPDLGSGIKNLKVPTLLMWGGKDKWTPVKLAHQWKSDQPESFLKVYPELGHVPMEESPQITSRDFSTFLQSTQ